MIDAALGLKEGGVEALMICTNTMHRMADAGRFGRAGGCSG